MGWGIKSFLKNLKVRNSGTKTSKIIKQNEPKLLLGLIFNFFSKIQKKIKVKK
jgi:hypothetical protein